MSQSPPMLDQLKCPENPDDGHSPHKLEIALAAGCTAVVETNYEHWPKAFLEATGGRKARVVYDAVGKATLLKSLECAAPFGLVVCYGAASGPAPAVDPELLNTARSLFGQVPLRHADGGNTRGWGCWQRRGRVFARCVALDLADLGRRRHHGGEDVSRDVVAMLVGYSGAEKLAAPAAGTGRYDLEGRVTHIRDGDTLVSLLRSYALRRGFERLHSRSACRYSNPGAQRASLRRLDAAG